jgi:hypothetical protein
MSGAWKFNNSQIKLTGTMYLSQSAYINWGDAVTGSSGFGFRSDDGDMEFKNSGGSWTALGSATAIAADDITVGNAAVTLGNGSTSADITIDSGADIVFDAAGGNFEFKDSGTAMFVIDVDGTAGDIDVTLQVDGDDLVFNQYDGTEVLRLTDGGQVEIGDNLEMPTDSSVIKMGDGDDITITHDGTTGVVIAANPITFDSGADINIDAEGGDVVFKDGGVTKGSLKMDTANRFQLSSSISTNDLYLMSGRDIVLDADGAEIYFKDGGTTFATFGSGGDTELASAVSAKPVLILENTNNDATGATLKFNKDGGNVADNDVIGNIDWASEDDGDNAHTYARILGKVDDMTGGQEEGSLEFYVAEYDGTLTKGMDIVGLGSNGNITVDISTHDGSAGGLKLGGTLVTSDAGELNILDGCTAVVGELNYLDLGSTAVGTAIASKAVVLDSSKDFNFGTGDVSCTLLSGTVGSLVSLKVYSTIGHPEDTDLFTLASGEVTLAGDMHPAANNTHALGDSDLKWSAVYAQNVYTGDLHLENERGSWSVIEEKDFLTLRNNNSGKRFKLTMEDITDNGSYGPGKDGIL